MLWAPVLSALWVTWRKDESLSHGPAIFVLALVHLWYRRGELGRWDAAHPAGLALLIPALLLHLASMFADIVFLKAFSLLAVTLGVIWYLGGTRAFQVCLGALGFLAFVIPWPTTLSEKLAFPLQLTSSAYAGLFAGILGVPIVREGVHLAVQTSPTAKPIYSVLVAQQCSGLTSMIVLLSLGYLIAYHTPVKLWWRALMVAAMVPLTLLANTVRLTLILIAGAYYSPALATWVHDHEAPVLIFFCSIGILAVRQALLSLQSAQSSEPEAAA
jgi:exosortase